MMVTSGWPPSEELSLSASVGFSLAASGPDCGISSCGEWEIILCISKLGSRDHETWERLVIKTRHLLLLPSCCASYEDVKSVQLLRLYMRTYRNIQT